VGSRCGVQPCLFLRIAHTLSQLCYTECPVSALVDPSPGEHAPDRQRRELLVGPPYFTLPHVPSSVAAVVVVGWPEDLRSTLVAQKPPKGVEPITGNSTPGSGCWRTLERATMGALPLLVQPNPFEAHPFKALRDVIWDASSLLRWPWRGPRFIRST